MYIFVKTNGVVAAFSVARTFSRIRVTYYCDGLWCGEPLGFLDWPMLTQAMLGMVENIALFGAAALVVEYYIDRGFLTRMQR